MHISRRSFLESATLAALALPPAPAAKIDKRTGMPMRTLGKTGAQVSILGFGCGSRFLSYKEEDKALEAGSRALEQGITYFDTAYGYGNGVSEERVGKLLKGRRKGIWVATKINKRGGDESLRILEGSLKRLQMDQVDLIHIHTLAGPEDLAAIEAKDGVLAALYKLRDQKVTRFIGVTSHTDPLTLKTALERHDFDCTQMALNAALVGMRSGASGMVINEALRDSFEAIALPVALRKKMGVTAMKIFAQEGLVGKASPETLIRYGLSLPVACAVVGMPKPEFIDENTRIAKAFRPLPQREMKQISTSLAQAHKARLDRFFRDHVDA